MKFNIPPQLAKVILDQKNNGSIYLLNFKLYCKTVVIKTVV